MNTTKTIQSALIFQYFQRRSRADSKKTAFSKCLFYSTGGTEDFIKNLGIPVTAVEDVTYPSILGGRVKLHPKVFGGILNRQDNESDVQQMKEFDIPNRFSNC
jgi:phosphoribosylaminoimidazolecarboxamide formyltransferase/IMP cyclohydrolase